MSGAQAAVLDRAGAGTGAVAVDVEGHKLSLSNLGKVLYPGSGFTKAQVVQYYGEVSSVLLPHLEGRPLTMKRYPGGVEGEFFYEKRCPRGHPEWLRVAEVPAGPSRRSRAGSEPAARGSVGHCLIDDRAGLTWVANLASLELHTSLSTWEQGSADIGAPTAVVFDLDPGEGAGMAECAAVALQVREILDGLELACFAKTSGSKGIQVYLPLNGGSAPAGPGGASPSYDTTKPFAHSLATVLESAHPAAVVSVMRKDLRRGKVLIDWSQNDRHKTTVCAYSLRALGWPSVSTPLHWEEVGELAAGGSVGGASVPPAGFRPADVLERVRAHGDVFEPVLTLRQDLPAGASDRLAR
ncbi:MAG: non-homologous end-joining DNA ligase [Acidimicrobiales bacterium]